MILECDLGNSSCKWRVIENGIISASGVATYPLDNYDSFPNQTITQIKIASVQSEQTNNLINTIFKTKYSLEPQWALVTDYIAGVSCGYREPERLGIDRWLGVVAAYNTYGRSIIVDVGSAMTVDVVSESGAHYGGYIMPGARLMKSALFNDTKKVRFADNVNEKGVGFGCSTEEAVNAGIKAALVGSITIACNEADEIFQGQSELVITGGGAKQLLSHLPRKFNYCPDLVLDGLMYVLP